MDVFPSTGPPRQTSLRSPALWFRPRDSILTPRSVLPTWIRRQGPDADRGPQDDSGWTPLMIAVSVKDAEAIVDLLLSKGADVNEKSALVPFRAGLAMSFKLTPGAQTTMAR